MSSVVVFLSMFCVFFCFFFSFVHFCFLYVGLCYKHVPVIGLVFCLCVYACGLCCSACWSENIQLHAVDYKDKKITTFLLCLHCTYVCGNVPITIILGQICSLWIFFCTSICGNNTEVANYLVSQITHFYPYGLICFLIWLRVYEIEFVHKTGKAKCEWCGVCLRAI